MDTSELTYEERRELLRDCRRQELLETARSLGVNLNYDDIRNEDLNMDEVPSRENQTMSMTEEEDRAREAEAFLLRSIPRYVAPNNRERELSNEESPTVGLGLASGRVCNAIKIEGVFRAYITDSFKEQIFKCPSVQRLYILIQSWVLQERVFKDWRQFSGQLTRYGVTYVSTTSLDGCETIEYSMDPYYHDKQAELLKRRNRMEQHKTTRRVALAASRLSRLRINFDKSSDDYIGGGSDEEDNAGEGSGSSGVDASMRVASKYNVIETIDEEEIPSYIDDHIRMSVIFHATNNINVALRGTVKAVYFTCHDAET